MPHLPVMLNVTDRRCLIVGGGAVALRRARALLAAGANVAVVAPEFCPEVADLNVIRHQRAYRQDDLQGVFLVVIATDNSAVNQEVMTQARTAGILVNRADEPGAGDLAIPAHAHHGPITLAVYTDGISAAASAAIRGELSTALDPHWQELLLMARHYRRVIRELFSDPGLRRTRLQSLTGQQARQILKSRGPEALDRFYQAVADPASTADSLRFACES